MECTVIRLGNLSKGKIKNRKQQQKKKKKKKKKKAITVLFVCDTST